MKRIFLTSLAVVFCFALFFLEHFGVQIREILAPRVTVCEVFYSSTGYVLPKDVIYTDEEGRNYIYLAETTDKYPEKGYEAVRADCEITGTLENEVFLRFLEERSFVLRVIISSDKPVYDGQKVNIQ